MKIIINIVASIILIVAIAFTILPMDTIAFLPIGATLLLGGISYFLINKKKQKWEKYLLIISLALAVIVVFKYVFIKDEVSVDTEFEQKQIDSQKGDIEDLEELEDLEGL